MHESSNLPINHFYPPCYNGMMKVLQELRSVLCRQQTVVNALLFGSYADGSAHAMSDLDIAIETNRGLSLLEMGTIISDIESVIDKKVDLVILNDLYKKSPLLAYNIYLNHRVLCITDEEKYRNFKENALHYYLDFKHALDEQNVAFSRRIADGNLAKIKTA
jgi:predicted nucleotidyltransferase